MKYPNPMKIRKKLRARAAKIVCASGTQSLSSSLVTVDHPHSMALAGGAIEGKRVVEALLADFRSLSQEARKKHNHVKEAAEAAVVKVRNISTGSSDASLLQNLRTASVELLHPLVLGCATKNVRLVQISLQGIQRLVHNRILEPASAPVVVTELWSLVESDCEELKVLQTVLPFVSTELLVTGPNLAKCIVMCFRMNFAKDPTVINAASAAVRQLVGCVYERVIQEDGMKSGELSIVSPPMGKQNLRAPPPTLRPCAADGYMLFRDLCLLINAEPPVWLQGITDMTRTLGLELLESVLRGFPSIFFKHVEFSALLKEEVCPLVIKLFSPNLKNIQISSQHPAHRALTASNAAPGSPEQRPYFPIAMRLVRVLVQLIGNYHQLLTTECEIFLSLLNKFLESDKLGWQRALALEALHRLFTQPNLLSWLVQNFDMRSAASKVCENTVKGLYTYLKASFTRKHLSSTVDDDSDSSTQFGVPGFYHNGTWIPLIEGLSARKGVLLECLEKHEAPLLQDGYCVSRGALSVADITQSVFAAVDQYAIQKQNAQEGGRTVVDDLDKELFNATYPSLLSALTLLLEASTDESTTESLLSCLSTLSILACRLQNDQAREACLYAVCAASLPGRGYLHKFAAIATPDLIKDAEGDGMESPSQFHQVVATGTPCLSPLVNSSSAAVTQVMLTAKNVQCFRSLLGTIGTNAGELCACWHLCLTTCQHVVWLLAMKPAPSGHYTRLAGDDTDASTSSTGQSSTSTVTTAARSDIPIVSSMLDKLFESSAKLDDVALHHVVAALCKLSSEALTVSQGAREPSFFPVAKLLHTGTVNLFRMETYWKPLTHHFIEVCGHSFAPLRDWSAVALTSLVKSAVRAKCDIEEEKRQHLVISPLAALSEIDLMDVRKRQIDCLMSLLQSDGSQLKPSLWSTVIAIIADIVDPKFSFGDSLIKHAYLALRLVAADFLQQLPWDCVEQLVEADKRYGQQHAEHNISLSALAQLWTISDFVYRKSDEMGAEAAEKVWLVLYNCLSELCVDSRPPVRKSACQTLLQTVAAHGHALQPHTWDHMMWKVLIPMLDKVRALTRSASTERSSSALLIHHSRDTEAKQWTETCIHTMQAICRIVNVQRSILLQLEDFGRAWETLLEYIEWAAGSDNAELSLASIKCLQEILLGKISAQTLDINTKERSTTSLSEAAKEDDIPKLPQQLWILSWKSWIRIAQALVVTRPTPDDPKEKPYVPGPSHLTTLLHIFSPLFEKVKKDICVEELKYPQLPSIFEALTAVPIPAEQAPFVLTSAGSLTPTQEAVLDCVKAVYQEMSAGSSVLRGALPDLLRLLLKFASLAAHPPPRQAAGHKDYNEWALQNVVPFAESSLRKCVDYLGATAHYKENVEALVLIDFVRTCADCLALKYKCLSHSSWKLSASAMLNILRIGLPIARQRGALFAPLWPVLASSLEQFLFSNNNSSILNPDERKRDEFVDCQFIELLRNEVLPFTHSLPSQFVQQIIAILNKGSICNLDPTDVLASESYTQRVELSRACFDALLSMSRDDASSSSSRDTAVAQHRDKLGQAAITSLLDRCKQVMTSFARDSRGAGDMRLPSSRQAETVASLQAVVTLIERLAGRSDAVNSVLYSQLVNLYPSLVDLIPCCHADKQVETALVSAVKSYQTLLLLKSIPQQNNF